MFTFTQSFPHRLTLNPVHIPLPVGRERGAMSTRCGASDLGNLLVLWDRSIGPQINWLHVRAIRLTWRCRGAERAVNRLFNSPGHRPGGHSSSWSLRFIFFFLSPPSPFLSPHSIVLLHWLHFSQCGYSRRTSAYRNIAWRDCVCVRECVCIEERFWPMNPCCVLCPPVLCLYWVSDPLGCSTHIQHPSLFLPPSIFLLVYVSLSSPYVFVSAFVSLTASVSLFLPLFLSISRQRQQMSMWDWGRGGLIWKRTQTRLGRGGRFVSRPREVYQFFIWPSLSK